MALSFFLWFSKVLLRKILARPHQSVLLKQRKLLWRVRQVSYGGSAGWEGHSSRKTGTSGICRLYGPQLSATTAALQDPRAQTEGSFPLNPSRTVHALSTRP